MLGIAAAVVIWLSLTTKPAAIGTAARSPKAVVKLTPAANSKKSKPGGRVSAALSPPPPQGAAPHAGPPAAHQPVKTPTPGAPEPLKKSTPAAHEPEKKSAPPRVIVTPIEKMVTERVPGQLRLPILKSRRPLPPAPAPGLVQASGLGSLPIISTDGRLPWRTYSRPFDRSNKKPRIAMVITGLGLSSAATNIAIQSLPGAITLAFAPYADRLNEWIRLARTAGHEVLLNVPMEPVNYPAYDPGPQTLLTSLPPQENVERLLWTLSRGTGYVGVVDFMGSRFTTSRKHLRPILKMLKQRGLMFLDSKSASRSLAPVLADDIGTPFAANSRFIDETASRFAIDKQLALLEAAAKKQKSAIGMGSPYPVTLERISRWVKTLGARGFVLAPVSAMVKRE